MGMVWGKFTEAALLVSAERPLWYVRREETENG
jgi:hypothetical protein